METKEKKGPEIFAHMLSREEIDALPGREMKEKRTDVGKLYDLGDGHYQAVLYPEPVHIQNAQGEWEEIDHTLVQKGDAYENTSPDLSVRFSPGGCVTLSQENHTLSWSLPDAAPVCPEEIKPEKKSDIPRQDEKIHLESAVKYQELLPGVDMLARIRPNRFKDTLVFKNQQAVRPVEFHLHAPGMRLVQKENGDVLALDGDEMIFRLPAPFAVDEQGDPIPGSAHVDLKELDRGYWAWIVSLDAAYAAHASFPISLDPVVETGRTSDAASMAYVSSANPSTSYPVNTQETTKIAHNHYSLGECYTFLRFEPNALPVIDSSYYVTAATLTMKSTSNNDDRHVYLREVLNDWNASTITYTMATNGTVNVGDKYLEYDNAGVAGSTLDFNIANQVRKWYSGTNNGLRLEILESGLVQLGAMGAVYDKPYVTITYVSLAGLEGYLAQESHGCGRAGTAYVGLFNGNLVVAHQDTNMNGSLMPFSVTRYYNSCYRDVNPFGAGYGWKYSSQQTLHQETIGSVLHYVYMDGDGTRHHFKQTSGSWNDLSGLSLKLTFSGSTATITDKGDNTMTFDKPTVEFNNNYSNVKMIKTMADAQGNTITFTHNSSRLTTAIKDGANRTTTLTATSITAPGMNAVTSVLTSNKLTKITHEDGKYVQYAYDSSTGLLNKMTNHDNSSLEFTYTSQAPYRVTLVTYKDKNSAVCGGRKYEYGDCRTTVTEMIPNGSALTEGKTLVYHFNDAGNVVSVNDGLGYGCFAGYSASMPLNHPEYTSKMQRAVNNYLKNHNFLSVNTDWTSQNLNGATGSGAYNSDEIYAGGRAYKLSKTNASGQVTVYQNVTLAKNKTYTFSCYYKTAGSSSVQIRAEYKNSSGTTVYAESATAVSTDRWDRIFVPFTVPSNSTSTTVTIRMMAVGGSGSVWVDAAQVEDGPVANRYNLMQNGAFTMNSSGVPTGWSAGTENVAADDCLVSGSAVISGRPTELTGNVLRLKGAPGKDKYFYQYFSCMGNAGDTYVAGGWSANYSRPRFDTATGVPCLYQMEVLARATSSGNYVSAGKVRWSDEWSGWHFAAIPVVMPVNYSDVRIILTYRNNLNEAQFSNLFLHREEFGKTFAYDSSGNVTSVKNLAALQSYATYDSFNNMLTYRQPGRPSSAQYTQTWGSSDAEKKKHLLRTSKSPLSIWQEYSYDSKGNPTSAKTRNGSS
ncbi:MAG: carbohydrate binding domain-containing protein, partial [Clostridia bacterium]|nr:carbohydrate binding domain-containing protein [Clostridia bacterium]